MKRALFIDTDTASDDAVALMMAHKLASDSLVGFSLVAGNVPLALGLQNALFVNEMCGARVPVYAGADRPLVRELQTADHVHGKDGMSDIGLHLEGREYEKEGAISALIAAAEEHKGELELITIGPLTNIALALRLRPDLPSLIKHCYIMGGTSDYHGNVTPISEYNCWADPEAADAVFASELEKTMIGWDISRKFATFVPSEVDTIRALNTDLATVAMDIQKAVAHYALTTTKLEGFDLPDPIAMAVALDESVILEERQAAVTVVMGDGPTRGMTIIDDRDYSSRLKNTRVVTKADRAKFISMLHETLG